MTDNLFIGNIFRPETSCYNNNENAWDRLSLYPTITSWRKRRKSWTKQWLQTSSVLLPHPLPEDPGGCCCQRQCKWQQEDGHHCLLTRLQSCWVVMIRDHKITWEEDIIFTRSISTSILEIWHKQSKIQKPNSAQTSSSFRAGKHHVHCWNKTHKPSMHECNRRFNWEERQGTTEVSTTDLALPNQCTHTTACPYFMLTSPPPSVNTPIEDLGCAPAYPACGISSSWKPEPNTVSSLTHPG